MKNYLVNKSIYNNKIDYYYQLHMIKLFYGKLDKHCFIDLHKIKWVDLPNIKEYFKPLYLWYEKVKSKNYIVNLNELLVDLTDIYYQYFKYESVVIGVSSRLTPAKQLSIMFERIEQIYLFTKNIKKEQINDICKKMLRYKTHRMTHRRTYIFKQKRGK